MGEITKVTGITARGEALMQEMATNGFGDREFTLPDGSRWVLKDGHLTGPIGVHKNYCRSCTEGTGFLGDVNCRG